MSVLRVYERGTYAARHGPSERRAMGAGRRGPLPSALVADDGTAPPVTDYQRGWEDGWCGTPSRIEGEEYAAGHADGSGCKRRREAVDRARICRVARS